MTRPAGTPIPDDGIPVLTDVVDAAALAPAPDAAPGLPEAPRSLAMFPELEPGLEPEPEPGPGPAPFATDAPAEAYLPAPAAEAPAPSEDPSREVMETRIFEALAARLDRLLDERLAPVIEGSVDAAFAGVKAALSASLNEAVREAVEQAVRDEFDRRAESRGRP